MIEMAQAVGVQVVLVGVPDKMLFASSASFYGELAEQYQLLLIDGPLASLLRDDEFKSDPIHLNARGYRRLAEELHQALVEHGALL
jgi:lysophospholipase L1-like esterase